MAAAAIGPDADERTTDHAVAGRRSQKDVVVHIRQDLGPQNAQTAIGNGNPSSHRHLRLWTLLQSQILSIKIYNIEFKLKL